MRFRRVSTICGQGKPRGPSPRASRLRGQCPRASTARGARGSSRRSADAPVARRQGGPSASGLAAGLGSGRVSDPWSGCSETTATRQWIASWTYWRSFGSSSVNTGHSLRAGEEGGGQPVTTWTLLFEPLGVLMFRDHRPFDAGRDGIARSRFPYPSVFRGAVRSALFENSGADFSQPRFGLEGELAELLGDDRQLERFALRGPMLARCACGRCSCACIDRRFEYLLPWPADLVEVRDAGARHDLRSSASAGLRRIRLVSAGAQVQELQVHEIGLPWTRGKLAKPSGSIRCLTPSGGAKYVRGGERV